MVIPYLLFTLFGLRSYYFYIQSLKSIWNTKPTIKINGGSVICNFHASIIFINLINQFLCNCKLKSNTIAHILLYYFDFQVFLTTPKSKVLSNENDPQLPRAVAELIKESSVKKYNKVSNFAQQVKGN
jgi:hypothetical protein